jgi:hypothetical protein
MNTARIRMTHKYGETPKNVFGDFDWIHRHRQELLEKYGERSIIVYKEQVIGVGDTYEAAVQDAEFKLAPEIEEVTPVHVELYYHNPFTRIQRKSEQS